MTAEATVASACAPRRLGRGEADRAFCDLMYALAITQLTRSSSGICRWGASETLLLLLAVSEARNYTSWSPT
jgi:hypothetical protein